MKKEGEKEEKLDKEMPKNHPPIAFWAGEGHWVIHSLRNGIPLLLNKMRKAKMEPNKSILMTKRKWENSSRRENPYRSIQ